uniref:Uncharacterized protein n=1 Tax=Esox lucius TaxID=8010 RepID=A0A3P8Y125_ESOLU
MTLALAILSEDHDTFRLNYSTGDLFTCPGSRFLAHCNSEDVCMGIAVRFKQKFRGVTELKERKRSTGQCAVLNRDQLFIYYLITKKRARLWS